ncbi:unnamed protein product [Ceratitis capitata]|uniref:(Mediterranean fruit fly) hypothetical protein n=1 Tax=Ceratitis capitata TaxID=7213 RepID=A0A811UXN1_CERCA|nr:unnamed protein product [Ceratitis capitata]
MSNGSKKFFCIDTSASVPLMAALKSSCDELLHDLNEDPGLLKWFFEYNCADNALAQCKFVNTELTEIPKSAFNT